MPKSPCQGVVSGYQAVVCYVFTVLRTDYNRNILLLGAELGEIHYAVTNHLSIRLGSNSLMTATRFLVLQMYLHTSAGS